MFSSVALALTICLGVGTIIVVTLVSRLGADESIARVLYDTEHLNKTR